MSFGDTADDNRLKQIRQSERESHIKIYTENKLYAEVNLGTEELQTKLKDLFADWQELKSTVVRQKYDIPRDEHLVELISDVVTFVAKNV